MRRRVISVVVGALLAPAGATFHALAQEPSKQESLGAPHTVEEHMAKAAAYREKAAQYRKEADEHRKMLEDHRRGGPAAMESKTGREAPWVAKMRKHCERYIKAAEAIAAEAESFASFHRMRAEEMQGK
jgi:hypothetical protein